MRVGSEALRKLSEQPEGRALQENLVRYEVARAQYLQLRDAIEGHAGEPGIDRTLIGQLRENFRMAKAELKHREDALVATWRDTVDSYLKQYGYGDPRILHLVMNTMDEFLKRSKE